MNRREFLRRASLVAAGAVAADQLDLLERLGWRRRVFPGWSPPTLRPWPTAGTITAGEDLRAGELVIVSGVRVHGIKWRVAPDAPIACEFRL